MKLRARKNFTYATRRLTAGDEFEPKKDLDGKILCGIGKAELVRDVAPVPAPPAEIANKIAEVTAPMSATASVAESVGTGEQLDQSPPSDLPSDLAAARAEYRDKVGKQPFMGWSAETLREKIAEATADNHE